MLLDAITMYVLLSSYKGRNKGIIIIGGLLKLGMYTCACACVGHRGCVHAYVNYVCVYRPMCPRVKRHIIVPGIL